MHKQLKLRCITENAKLTYNFPTVIGNIVNKKISEVDPELGKKLHKGGIKYGNGHSAKLFIARLRPLNYSTLEHCIQVKGYEYVLDVRFYDPNLSKAFNKAILLEETFYLADKYGTKVFKIVGEKNMKVPHFSNKMKYKLRSPSSLSEKKKDEKKGRVIRPNEPIFIEKLQDHFLRKTDILYQFGVKDEGMEEGIEDLRFSLIGNKIKEKRLYFTPSSSEKAVGIKGYEYDFELVAPIPIQKLIYYGGFMENTARGFGYLDVLQN
ncbi:CRISPR-associated endoribonuclease Cas6 [Flammeovirga aprica]|uniref:CRISPR associated protein Cas6 C-terminal domain-containing protein n=1 Tax=Flammeovirga aprica JL-4 TaxID=694437 RepID=A0A7X9XBE4_9BACT|nr:CRISPR-associated endoribonuclease Cas6 [Flammeovirga aprica]NME70544.1 hypothetical protein [Flammeovirga aprica JL-4]